MSDRKVSVELVLNARNYLDESKKVLAQTKATEAAMNDLGDEADLTSADLGGLAKSTDHAKDTLHGLGDEADLTATDLGGLKQTTSHTTESLGGLGSKSRDTGEALRLLDARIGMVKISVRDLGIEFAHTGDEAVGKSLTSERSLLGRLTSLRKEVAAAHDEMTKLGNLDLIPGNNRPGNLLTRLFGSAQAAVAAGWNIGRDVATGFGSALTSMGPIIQTALIPILVYAAVLASPTIAAVIGGAVALGVGTLGLAGGILASIKNPAVQQAAQEFGSSISATFFQAGGGVFPYQIVKSLGILQEAFSRLDLEGIFRVAAPYVTMVAKGIAGMATEFMPRFRDALFAAGPGLEIMARQLPSVGAALGDMLKRMAESKGMLQGVEALFGLLKGTLIGVGEGVGWLSDRFYEFNNVYALTTGHLANLFGPDNPVGAMFAWMHDNVHKFIGEAKVVPSIAADVGGAFKNSVAYPARLAAEAAERLTIGLRNANDMMTSIIDKNLSFDQAIVRMEQGFRTFGETIKQNGRHWTDNTAAAEANQSALFDQIAALEQLRLKNIEATGDVAGANVEFDNQLRNLLAIASAAGAGKEMLDRIAGTYLISINAKIVMDGAAAIAQWATKALEGMPWRGGPSAGLSQTPSKPPTGGPGQPGKRRAHGGPVGPGSWVVGDGGRPEVLTLGPTTSGHVYPSVQSWQAAQAPAGGWQSGAGMGGGGGGGASGRSVVDLNVVVSDTSGRMLRQELITDALNRNQSSSVVRAAYP